MASKKRGVSYEEKRQRMKDLFHETKGVFTLKELEKIASKEKGIIRQAVEEVLKSLVDDSEVLSDKIGTSNYFWAFPSQEIHLLQTKQETLAKELSSINQRAGEISAGNQKLAAEREKGPERDEAVREMREEEARRDGMAAEVEKFSGCDPRLLEATERDSATARDAANRWTDNVLSLRKWCESHFGLSSADFNSSFGVEEELENLE